MCGVPLTERRIDQAALELFAEKGFNATGIRELAARAGVSTAALYHYMGTKEDLLVQVMKRGIDRMLELAHAALDDATSPAERLARLVTVHVHVHIHGQLEALVIDNELRALSGTGRTSVIELRDTYEMLWRNALADGLSDGTFSFGQVGVARLALLEMCTGVAHWYVRGGPLDELTLEQTFVDMAFGLMRASGASGSPLTHRDVRVPDLRELSSSITVAFESTGAEW